MALQVSIKKKLNHFTLEADFEAQEGVLAILGASGCGKSMTLKCVAGIETPDEGRIILNDRVLFDSRKKINLPPQKRNVGYMFQDYALFPHMSVCQNIMAGMGRKPRKEEAEKYLERFHLTELGEHYPGQLSGGQKQRVALARLIAQRPEVILLDEPFSALDSFLKWELEQEMRDTLAEVDKITLFVSHDRDEVYRLSQRVSCINRGKMELAQPVRDFFHSPQTRTAAMLSGCKNISLAERLDEHHLLAKDWNVVLTSACPIGEEIRAVGIRAHYFSPDKEGCDNCLTLQEWKVIEDPFEWNVSFRPDREGGYLQWKLPKKEGTPISVPERLYVDSRNLLLLK